MDSVTQEISVLKREKLKLEQERAQKEADVRIRNGEVTAAVKEFEAISATLHQLERQKGEAQKMLDELDDKVNIIHYVFTKYENFYYKCGHVLMNLNLFQRSKLTENFNEVKAQCETEQKEIDELNSKLNSSELMVKVHDQIILLFVKNHTSIKYVFHCVFR